MKEKWFPEVHHHCPGVPCLIVGTQTDLREDAGVRDKLSKQRMSPVRKEDGERMAKDLGAVKYVECSALTQYKLKDVFDEVRFPISYQLTLFFLPKSRRDRPIWMCVTLTLTHPQAIVAALEPPPKKKGDKGHKSKCMIL